MTRLFLASTLALALMAAPAHAAGLCPVWGAPEVIGELDARAIPEASGLEWTSAHPHRLYHNNDSGDGGFLYVTDATGGGTRRVEIEGFRPRDAEDLTAGPCGAAACLVLADIGDNNARRDSVRLAVIEEPGETLPARAAPRAVIEARYPDGAHNAEAAAMHPDGALYVLTKTEDASPSRLYRLTAAQMDSGGAQDFAFVAEIPVAAMLNGLRNQKATAMDIAPDGARVVILTYMGAVEIAADLSAPFDPESWREGVDWRRIQTALLPQAEAVAYAGDGKSILYDSESARGRGGALVRQACLE